MAEPPSPGPIEPGRAGSSSHAWVLLALFAGALLALASVARGASDVFWAGALVLVLVTLPMAWVVSRWRRETTELERRFDRDPEPDPPATGSFSGILWTLVWVVFVLFDDQILARLSALLASWLEALGLPREETAKSIEEILLGALTLFVVWGWITSWRKRRRQQAAERGLAYGEEPES